MVLNRILLPEGRYENELLSFLKTSVPKVLILDNSWTVGAYKDNDVLNGILDQVSWWLFGNDQEAALVELEKVNEPSNICGHVFKPGEATYTCRECAVDPTCVLCQPCFRRSPHVHHKYKLHSSNGGGCCDCGDPEAWAKYPSCNIHTVDMDKPMVDARTRLPKQLRERAEHFFKILLDYVVNLLTVDRLHHNELPIQLTGRYDDTYLTVVFNDESHTFDYVISVLQRAVQCSPSTAADYATVIDREGRTVVLIGTEQECKESKDILMSTSPLTIMAASRRRRSPLMTKVMHSSVVAHEEFALALLNWISEIAKRSDGIRLIISHALLASKHDEISDTSPATKLMLADTTLWKVARGSYQQLLMSTLLLDSETKRSFGVIYTKIYNKLIEDYLLDDHDHGDSITSISVQLFTVPTVVWYLVVQEDLLCVILSAIIGSMCSEHKEPNKDYSSYEIDVRKLKKNFRRFFFVFYDLKYTLTNVPTTWDEHLKVYFKAFFRMFVSYLAALEGMNSVIRQTSQHLEHEPEWETGVSLQLRLIPVIGKLLQWCSSDEEMLVYCLEEVTTKLEILHKKENFIRITEYYPFRETGFECINYDITTNAVSVHYPLTRLCAALLVQFGVHDIPFSSKITNCILDVTEHSFRAVSLYAQVTAGAWRRNGLSLANQAFYLRDYQCRTESFDRDIQMMQACASMIDPDHFCIALQQKMNLTDYARFHEYLVSFYEEYLSLILYVAAERYTEGIGQVTYEERVKREVIHILASGPKPHSKIQKLLSDEISRKPDWESILNQVADYRPSTSIKTSAKYELKADYLQKVSPCFYHYRTMTEQTNAQNEVIRRKKANHQSCVFTPRPSPPFTKQFSQAANILQCTYFLSFLTNTIKKLMPNANEHLQWSDKLFEKILFIIGFGIVEERERVKEDLNSSFKFCERADKYGVLEQLRMCAENETVAIHRENICWIENAVSDVLKRRLGIIKDEIESSVSATSSVDDKALEAEMLKKKKDEANKRRADMMEQMKIMQQKFIERNNVPMEEEEEEMIPEEVEVPETRSEMPICTSLECQLSSLKPTDGTAVCLLCQDDGRQDVGMVLSAFVQMSSVLSKRRVPCQEAMNNLGDISNPAGIHLSTCSHVMHFDCWTQYFESVKERDERRPYRMRRFISSFSTSKNEFLCPLCSRLSNCIIPVVTHGVVAKQRGVSSSTNEGMSTPEWLKVINELVDPPEPVKQEVVIKLHLDDPPTSPDQEEWHDAPDSLPEGMFSTPELRASQEYMETDEDNVEGAYKVMLESMRKNCMDNLNISDKLLLWQAVVTTFQVAEAVSRFQETPLLTPPSIRLKETLSNVIRVSFMASKFTQQDTERHIYENMLRTLLGKEGPALLNMNIFHVFVRLVFSCECLRPTTNISAPDNDRNILFLCALAQIVQIIIYMDMKEVTSETKISNCNSPLIQLFNQVRSYANLAPSEQIDEEKLKESITFSFSPFIRCCLLFMHHYTNVPPLESLETQDNLNVMLAYLGLPKDILAYFDASGTTSFEPYVQRWCSNPSVLLTLNDPVRFLTFPDLAKVNTLIAIDEDYSNVIAKASEFVCPRFGGEDDSISPALCLICGAVLCSQSYCCQQELDGANVGACTYHAHQCGYGFGIFLRGRVCMIILHNQTRGSYQPAPYVDEYGETDQGLRRGNPLQLDRFRLKELNLLWLDHATAETIVREMESNRALINIDWNHY